MRDRADNCVVVCSIENFDPMGVHTGDSITVAPAQTLSDVEYQAMRDAAFACIRRVGVETGGSNIQFAVEPDDRRQVVIEMNPRVSRSSALASKATGFPIAKIAARLAVGYTLDEIPNDITRKTPASFEPTIDYVVTKVPRWAFEKLPGTSRRARHADAVGRRGDGDRPHLRRVAAEGLPLARDGPPRSQRRPGRSHATTRSTSTISSLAARSRRPSGRSSSRPRCVEGCASSDSPRRPGSTRGSSTRSLASPTSAPASRRLGLRGHGPEVVAARQAARVLRRPARPPVRRRVRPTCVPRRLAEGVAVTFKTVDTCGAEFEASTPYHYGTYEDEDEVRPAERPRIVILGSGPNRIGQGIEFDYCCVHASFVLRDAGYETVMVNCNPETVSTDYDTSDRLYFEPLTHEDVLNVIEAEQPIGVIVGARRPDAAQAGGRASARARDGHERRVDRSRRGPRAVERAVRAARDPATGRRHRDRGRRGARCRRAGGLPRARAPVVRARRTRDADRLRRRRARFARWPSSRTRGASGAREACRPSGPVLIDRFLEDAVEVDVDAIRDATGEVLIGGVMEHVEEAGVHSGDSACALPPSLARARPSSR